MATKTENKESVFSVLNAIDVNEHTEKKDNLTYLSWSWAWAEVKKRFPDADYKIFRDESNRPYIEDPDFGLMCYTSVTIDGKTYEMWLPVMDSSNNAMKRTPYEYVTSRGKKTVKAATMFDINKTLMRCLVKNLAMFGLGLYIYSGEDLPEDAKQQISQKESELEEAFSLIKANILTAPSKQYLMDLHKQNTALHDYAPYKNAMNKRFKEVE